MKNTMIFSSLAFFLMTLFAFTPADHANANENLNASFSICTGAIQATPICATEDPSDAILIITNEATGVVAYTGPANGTEVAVTLLPGNYVITSESRDCFQVRAKWEFCTNADVASVPYVNGVATLGVLVIC